MRVLAPNSTVEINNKKLKSHGRQGIVLDHHVSFKYYFFPKDSEQELSPDSKYQKIVGEFQFNGVDYFIRKVWSPNRYSVRVKLNDTGSVISISPKNIQELKIVKKAVFSPFCIGEFYHDPNIPNIVYYVLDISVNENTKNNFTIFLKFEFPKSMSEVNIYEDVCILDKHETSNWVHFESFNGFVKNKDDLNKLVDSYFKKIEENKKKNENYFVVINLPMDKLKNHQGTLTKSIHGSLNTNTKLSFQIKGKELQGEISRLIDLYDLSLEDIEVYKSGEKLLISFQPIIKL